MNETQLVESKAAALRQAFDLSFALPPPPASPEVEDLLTIRVVGDPYAVRLSDITGMIRGPKVVPVPAVTLDLLGLAGIRGRVVPVFGLSSILGYPPAPGTTPWMILCGAEEPIALAFSEFEGYVRLPKSSFHADESVGAARNYVNQIVSTEAGVRAVIGIQLVVGAIRNRIGRNWPAKEP